jgi:Na+/proline symporter
MLTQHLPDALLALVMLLVLSASMSTLASLVLVSSSAVAIDLYKGYLHPDVDEKRSLVMMRVLSGFLSSARI